MRGIDLLDDPEWRMAYDHPTGRLAFQFDALYLRKRSSIMIEGRARALIPCTPKGTYIHACIRVRMGQTPLSTFTRTHDLNLIKIGQSPGRLIYKYTAYLHQFCAHYLTAHATR